MQVNVSCYQVEHTTLYSYTDPATGQTGLAKSSGRSETEVLAAWASVGLAPAGFDIVDLGCNKLLIEMELLPEAWRVLSDLSDSKLLEAKAHVLQELQCAQTVEIHTGGLVLMQLPTVAVLLGHHQWHIGFLNFEKACTDYHATQQPIF